MGINEMEFQWRLNWWYRPTQLDGFESSVADYYECFCDWKASMELNSCPDAEVDYVQAFVQNLRSDIRSRLPKYIFSRRLNCAFLTAKLEESTIRIEESLMRIDEALKRNGAHKPFDETPSQVSANCQEHSSDEVVQTSCLHISSVDSCTTGLANNPLDDVVMADAELSNLKDDEFLNSDVGASIIDVLSTQIDSTKVTHKVFDDLTESILDQVLGNVGYISQAGTFDQVLGSSGDEALKFVNKSTGIQLLKKVEGSFLAKQEDLEISCKVLDEMPLPFFVKPKGEIIGDVDPIAPTDGVPRVFDPGISISLCIRYELFQPSIILITGSKSIYCQFHSFASFLGQCKSVISITSTNMVFIFDPGGGEEPFGFLCEGVFGMLRCHLVQCLVRCMCSHIISLVDEMKRADMGNEEFYKLFGMINGVVKRSWLGNSFDAINKRSNAFEFRDDRQHHDQ